MRSKTSPVAGTRQRYDWRACAISVVVGLAVAGSAGLIVSRLIGSNLFLTAIVTLVGTLVSRWTYARTARRGARPIEGEI